MTGTAPHKMAAPAEKAKGKIEEGDAGAEKQHVSMSSGDEVHTPLSDVVLSGGID